MNTLLLNRDGFQIPAGEWEAWDREEGERKKGGKTRGADGEQNHPTTFSLLSHLQVNPSMGPQGGTAQ